MRNPLRKLLVAIFSLRSWVLFLSRGDVFLIINGALYLRSLRATELVSRNLAERFQAPGQRGELFLRVDRFLLGQATLVDCPHSLLISGLGRFGNSIQQLLNSTSLALFLEVDTIFFHPAPVLPVRGLRAGGPLRFTPSNLLPGWKRKTPASVWRSDFFDNRFRGIGFPPETISALRPSLAGAMSHLDVENQGRSSALTIHVRSGDIYGVNPHPNYGQPPVTFYRQVLQSREWDSVVIVAEDDLSPALHLIAQQCKTLNISVRVVGAELDEAMREIVAARNLVASRGTFVPALVFLFPKPRTIFHFGNDLDLLSPDENLTVVTYEDVGGLYRREILDGNWKNSPEQRALMVDYPARSVRTIGGTENKTPKSKRGTGL
jgi:hypothetical protein